jgi:hypothetical protein
MSSETPVPPDSRAFRIFPEEEQGWKEADIGLPPGVQHKVLHLDPVTRRRVSKVRFAPGYIEPEHTHTGWHSVFVVKGRMCVAGQDLRPGSYIFGWDIPHGPFEYPDGCEVFTVSMGENMHHKWELAPFLAYKRQWAAETEEGRRGCAEFDRWREQQARSARG